MQELLQKKVIYHDRKGDLHYNLISALHKSIRGSDCDAALYWLSRLLSAGEDQNFILRRLTRISIEDIGLADPSAVRVCLDCWNVFRKLGAQEGDLAIAQAVIYLSLAPKSISSYVAFKNAMKTAKSNDSFLPPSHLFGVKHPRMLELGFGENYEYDPEFAESFSGQNYFPDQLKPIEFYKPVDRGFERDMNKRLRYYSTLRKKNGDKKAK